LRTFLCLAWAVTPRLTRAMADLLKRFERVRTALSAVLSCDRDES
jgi:hypothetical protein